MPLIKSGSRAAVSQNISEMVHSGHPQRQAIAAALSNARKYGAKMAMGGVTPPFGERMAARSLMHEGYVSGVTPGRSDKLPITVGGGSYVVPADHLAALGQGNSQSGANILNRIFKMGPYGTPLGGGGIRGIRPNIPRLNNLTPKIGHFASGGTSKPTPIISHGEFVIPPHKLIEKFGDLNKAHATLDKWIVDTRKKHVKTLQKLKPPKKD